MEGSGQNGTLTNHDRDTMANGIVGGLPAEGARVKTEPSITMKPSDDANGINGVPHASVAAFDKPSTAVKNADATDRFAKPPPEIAHITDGFEPLSKLLSRLTQVTHNRLSAKITELASISVTPALVNGNGPHYLNGSDDNPLDGIKKRVNLLNFAEETHANFTKALVITHWSRVHEEVGKLIDLKVHLDAQRSHYDMAIYEMSEVKRSLIHAAVPNPDLRTAVEVLSTGKASWMPDLGYVEPPPLKGKDILQSLNELNTLLSIRLNLHEYDTLPWHFRDYSIQSGRVTFRVAGEFEVDLTIADEDPSKQFWFIDFRFLFTPAVSALPESLLYALEDKINAALAKDGLSSCYKFLHELVLTHKINEFRKQAIELARGPWTETLKVEPLHRALSIQYWVDRYSGRDGPRCWFVLGVDSGRPRNGRRDPKATSRLSLSWFKDGKEIKDHGIPVESGTISVELLLRSVISRHISDILRSVHANLSTKPLFKQRQLGLSLGLSGTEPRETELKVQLTRKESTTVTVDPVTGRFAIDPATRLTMQAAHQINEKIIDPANKAHESIENLRCLATNEEMVNRAMNAGWIPIRNPGFNQESLKAVVPKDTKQLSWFRRGGWNPSWVVALSSSMSGEHWWLLEIAMGPPAPRILNHFRIPLSTTSLNVTHTFLTNLNLLATAMITDFCNARAFHSRSAKYILQPNLPKPMSLATPNLLVQLSSVIALAKSESGPKNAWAKDLVRIRFHSLTQLSKRSNITPNPDVSRLGTATPGSNSLQNAIETTRKPEEDEVGVTLYAEAHLAQPLPSALGLAKYRVDRDIVFHAKTGAIALRLQTKVGESAIEILRERLARVKKMVEFVNVLKTFRKTLRCEGVSLGKLTFGYGNRPRPKETEHKATDIDPKSKAFRATIIFTNPNAPMTLALERGNPDLRILDYLTNLLNSPHGLKGVAKFMSLTLPLMTALSVVEDAWTPLSDEGEAIIISRAIEHHLIKYMINSTAHDHKPRPLVLEITLNHKKGEPWWWLRRRNEDDYLAHGQRRNSTISMTDEVDLLLKQVWEENFEDADGQVVQRGMGSSAMASVEGVGRLVARIDGVIRQMVTNGIAPEVKAELREMQQGAVSPVQARASAAAMGSRQAYASQQHAGTQSDMIVID
jgi:mediator of RNA polymerase II transcription subunit 14